MPVRISVIKCFTSISSDNDDPGCFSLRLNVIPFMFNQERKGYRDSEGEKKIHKFERMVHYQYSGFKCNKRNGKGDAVFTWDWLQ